jgi:hypothetical protein
MSVENMPRKTQRIKAGRASRLAAFGGAVIWRMIEGLALSAPLVLACALRMRKKSQRGRESLLNQHFF